MKLDERYLDLVVEEAAEIIQAITKIKRFGINAESPLNLVRKTNQEDLLQEIADLFVVVGMMGVDMTDDYFTAAMDKKFDKLRKYGPDGSEV